MLEIKIKVSDKDITDIQHTIHNFYSVKMSRVQIKQFLRKHIRLAAEVQTMGFDTVTRESFIEDLSSDLTGSFWPLNGDSTRYKNRFYKKFKEAVLKAGISYEG
jgi:hypothetical protein